ncbi:MAG: hypothetical protein JRH06_11900 [Deltaproteobacteria bacterium]|nr:hypothetical protein [Deltaproteobacteria bacterium]MBW2138245.1 hypothetical protein [Deltaproteobacteria bacterium]
MAKGKDVVWIIDSKQWPRACLRAELMERGFEAIGFTTLAQAIAAYHLRIYEKPRLIILDLFELDGEDEEIVLLSRLGIPVMLLGGAVQLNREAVRRISWAHVIRRPYTIGNIADKVEQLLK